MERSPALGTGSESISLTAPETAGAYYYGACVDAVADESDTTDNCSPSVKVEVGAKPPDLVVSTSIAYGTAGTFRILARVHNQGAGGSAATTLRYYRSTDATITTSDTAVGTDAVGGLAASESRAAGDRCEPPSDRVLALLQGLRRSGGGGVRHDQQLLERGAGGRRGRKCGTEAVACVRWTTMR